MAVLVVPLHRRRPGIYRLARAMRIAGVVALVLLVLFVATVADSAYQVATSSVQSHTLSVQFGANDSIEVTGSFTLSNPGYYPIQSFALSARLETAAALFLGGLSVGPTTIASGGTGVFPISVSIPISTSGPAVSLLTEDQILGLKAWANATYAFLFPLSVSLAENRSWGAPFEGFQATAGAPVLVGTTVEIPVTVTFANHASDADVGSFTYTAESSGFATCGSGSIPVSVAPGDAFDETNNILLSPGCSPAGGQLLVSYTTEGTTIVLPPEAIP